MVSGVILTCVVDAYLLVHVFLVARSKEFQKRRELPDGEGESSQATPAVLQNVPFPSKLETKGNMASNWKRFRRVWSNKRAARVRFEITSMISDQNWDLSAGTGAQIT